MVNTHGLGPCLARGVGSSPTSPTTIIRISSMRYLFFGLLSLSLLGAGCSSVVPSTNTVASTPVAQATKTYTNSACGFSFTYPSDLILDPDTETIIAVQTQADADFQKNQDGEVPPHYYLYAQCWPSLQALVAEDASLASKNISSLSDFMAVYSGSTWKVIGPTVVNGEPAFEVAHSMDLTTYALYVEHNTKIYSLAFSEAYVENGNAERSRLTAIQQQILESFTFIQ